VTLTEQELTTFRALAAEGNAHALHSGYGKPATIRFDFTRLLTEHEQDIVRRGLAEIAGADNLGVYIGPND
jgi:hypothetical protein